MVVQFYRSVNWLPVVALLFISGLHLLFAIRANTYFSQDDFAILGYFKRHSIWQMTRDFLTVGDLWGFRKVSGYLIMRGMYDLFRTNPWPYLLMNHFLHTANVLLIFAFVRRFTASNLQAFFAAILFNKFYLFYFSNIHEYLITLLSLLALWSLSMVAFGLAMLTKEIAAVVPLAALAINWRRRWPLWLMLAIYLVYQVHLFTNYFTLSSSHPYLATISNLSNAGDYIDLGWVAVLVMGVGVTRRYRHLPWLAASSLALAPALLLPNRHENYYLYLPAAYLTIFLGVALPRLSIRTAAVYGIVVIAFGGRTILPRFADQTFPNWQKVSIDNVLVKVGDDLYSGPAAKSIDLSRVHLERDSRLLLGSQVIDLFLDSEIVSKYKFNYDISNEVLYATASTGN